MSKCLITKIDASAESSYGRYGELIIKRRYLENEGTNNARVALGISNNITFISNPMTLTIDGEGEFFSDSARTISLGQTITIPANTGNVVYYTSNGNYNIIVQDKYSLRVDELNMGYAINLKDMFYVPNNVISGRGWYGDIKYLDPQRITQIVQISNAEEGYDIVGKLEDLAKMTKLTRVMAGKLTRGAFSDLGALTLLSGNCSIPVYGSIESFVHAQRANGRTVNTSGINFLWLASMDLVVTFNGNRISQVENNNISWTSDTITYNGTTISS